MTTEIALTLTITVAALVLFATERLRVDLVALLVLLSVALLRLINPEEIFDSSANPAVITVWAVYIVPGGLFRTGVADAMGRGILRLIDSHTTSLTNSRIYCIVYNSPSGKIRQSGVRAESDVAGRFEGSQEEPIHRKA